MILLIDNYDSFSYNLYQLVGSIDPDIKVIRNDEMTAEQISAAKPSAIIISPGPGRPEDAGVSIDVVKKLGGKVPILGVCLGHQAICRAYGGVVSYAKTIMHGKQSTVTIDPDDPLYKDCPQSLPVARYHSLAAIETTLSDCLKVTGRADDGEIMSVKHREFDVFGVQFHPESIMTPNGMTILKNFLNIRGGRK